MPQPVHYSQPIHVEFVPEAVLQRPELAAHIALISAWWNEIEARISAFLAALAGGEAETVISVFLAIKNDGAKRSTIDTISALKLSPDDYVRFQAILKRINERYSDRNTIIHGAWGISPRYPDKLLWSDIRESTVLHIEMMNLPASDRAARLISEQKKIMVYGLSDFLQIEQRIQSAYEELREFSKPFIEKGFGPLAKIDLPPTLIPQS
ncbi:MAG: hypothetical protein EXR12_09040 [Rhodospirillaceae bacterium]|nr:hypothetical protein [Rhodospirillaceae bacterium]